MALKNRKNILAFWLHSLALIIFRKKSRMDKKLTLADTIKAVATFHDSFGIKNNYNPTSKLEDGQIELRHRLMKEENDEYLEAAKEGDLVEIADALGDQLYILCGTIMKHGMQDVIED